MQTGLVSTENISQVLRNISQRKQNGALEIIQGDDKLQIVFSNGKIVDAYRESESRQDRETRRTQGSMDSSDIEKMRIAVKHDVLNFLFSLDLSNHSIFNFKNFMPEFNKELAANISVGQYLLDKASLDSESKRFNQIFHPNSSILKLDLAGLELSPEEQILYNSLGERTQLEEVFANAPLSRYHIVVYLLSFYERAIVEADNSAADCVRNSPADLSVVNVLEDHSERPFIEKELSPIKEPGLNSDPESTIAPKESEVPATMVVQEALAEKEQVVAVKPREKLSNSRALGIPAPVVASFLYVSFFLLAVTMFWRTYLRDF